MPLRAFAWRARAEMRLAEEYDAAQERGEVAKLGDNLPSVPDRNAKATASDLGLARRDIHEARRFRDAEAAEPGVIRRTLDGMLERGEEPTRAALRKEVVERPAAVAPSRSWLAQPHPGAAAVLCDELYTGGFKDGAQFVQCVGVGPALAELKGDKGLRGNACAPRKIILRHLQHGTSGTALCRRHVNLREILLSGRVCYVRGKL